MKAIFKQPLRQAALSLCSRYDLEGEKSVSDQTITTGTIRPLWEKALAQLKTELADVDHTVFSIVQRQLFTVLSGEPFTQWRLATFKEAGDFQFCLFQLA